MFSPDGHWVAYASDAETGRPEIFIQPYPATGIKYQVSKDSGHHPLWTPDGAKIIYDETAGRSLLVSLTLTPAFSLGSPSLLRRGNLLNFSGEQVVRPYDMAPDGRILGRIDAATATGSGSASRIDVVLNWQEELKRLAPTR